MLRLPREYGYKLSAVNGTIVAWIVVAAALAVVNSKSDKVDWCGLLECNTGIEEIGEVVVVIIVAVVNGVERTVDVVSNELMCLFWIDDGPSPVVVRLTITSTILLLWLLLLVVTIRCGLRIAVVKYWLTPIDAGAFASVSVPVTSIAILLLLLIIFT